MWEIENINKNKLPLRSVTANLLQITSENQIVILNGPQYSWNQWLIENLNFCYNIPTIRYHESNKTYTQVFE